MRFRALTVGGRTAHGRRARRRRLSFIDERRLRRLLMSRAGTLSGVSSSAQQRWSCPKLRRCCELLFAGVSRSSTREVLQSATYEAGCRCKFGHLDLTSADAAYHLLSAVDDPLVVSSFKVSTRRYLVLGPGTTMHSSFGGAARTANRYRLDFAIPYALASAATASAGLRKWRRAERYAAEALALSHESGMLPHSNTYSESTCGYLPSNGAIELR